MKATWIIIPIAFTVIIIDNIEACAQKLTENEALEIIEELYKQDILSKKGRKEFVTGIKEGWHETKLSKK